MGTENVLLLKLIRTVKQPHPVQACVWPLPTKNIKWRSSGYRLFCTWSAQLHGVILLV